MPSSRPVRPAIRTLLLLALAPLVGACASTPPTPVLEGTVWRIVEVDGFETDQSGERNLKPHLRILNADGRVHGATGCNNFSGAYQATGNGISFGPLVTTSATCPEPAKQIMEDRILEVIESATSYEQEGRWLWLYVNGEHRLTAETWN